MEQALSFAASNPDTTRLLFNYAWILIPVVGTVVTCFVRLIMCCLPATAGGMMGGSPIPGSLCSCCPTIQQTPSSSVSSDNHRDVEAAHSRDSFSQSGNRYDYVGPDSSSPSEKRKRTKVCSLLCCFCCVVIMLGSLTFAGLYPFLRWTLREQGAP